MTAIFIWCAVGGFALLVLGLVFDGLTDGVFDILDLDGGALLSAPVVGAFFGAFGVGGWATMALTDENLPAGIVGAGLAGVAFAWMAARVSKAFLDMPTDPTPSSGDFMGQLGKVVTPIVGGRGEVLLRVGGAPTKLMAQSDSDVPLGAEVVVIEVVSSSAVKVMPTSELFEETS